MRKTGSVSSASVVIVTSIFAAGAADTFRKLNDSEIRSKVSGMEIVDVEDHWAWISGNKIEFRGEGPRLGLQGILQRQQPRK